ncbi:alpha/beta hydrolase family protein [Anaerobaca lacustris]|uniref:Alpha/beta fold hydrolase n=1 Tax=Anaerobaca lacustris TaxID=3044600 RepID=A0AAW6U037_9BACT|nr:alpha/beta fold hydrolase [Sedimentisphaerales bacterium M17dextr]
MLTDVAGNWLGTITFGSVKLRIGFEISQAETAGYTGFMRSIDQSAIHIPISEVILGRNSVRVEIDAIRSAYEGTPTADGRAIVGNWLQHGTATPLVMERVDRLPEIIRPQTPKRPFPYGEEDVVYENASASVRIAGTLTLPEGNGPFPAVLLIVGSGPLDRDETVFFHKPFLVLADHLTRRGIAVLRVDKRGVGQTTGDFAEATIHDLADDVLAGVGYLKSRREIDPNHIGLLGHSEGGVVGPIAASRSADVAFLVMLAGLGQNNGDIIIFQKLLEARSHGAGDERLALMRAWYEGLYPLVREDTDSATAEKKIRALHATLTDEEKEAVGWPDSHLDDAIADQLRRHWRCDVRHDPRATLMKVRCPVLTLNGEKDMQVPAKENLAIIADALKAGGNPDFAVHEFPGLNHGFQTAHTQTASDEETISPVVLQTISDWLIARTSVPRP